MGLLWANKKSDILDPKSWHKVDEPVFHTDENNGIYGPGHNSFTISEDGKRDYLIYHARQFKEIPGYALDDNNRMTFAEPFSWTAKGMPSFK